MRSLSSGLFAFATLSLLLTSAAVAQGSDDPMQQAWLQFQKSHPGHWNAEWHPATGTPSAIFGQGTRVFDGNVENTAQASALAKTLLKKYADVLGAGQSTFQEIIGTKANRVFVFVYDQYYQGLPVIDGRADLRIHDIGVLSLLGSQALQIRKDFKVVPKLQPKHVWPLAHRYADQKALLEKKPAPADADVRLVIWADFNSPKKVAPTLAYQVQIDDQATTGLPVLGKVFVDANTGAFLEFRNEIYECSMGCRHVARQGAREVARPTKVQLLDMGATLRKPRKLLTKPLIPKANLIGSVKAWINNNHDAKKTLTNHPMANLRLSVAGSSTKYYTDGKGDFNITHSGTADINVTAHLDGKHIKSITSLLSPSTMTKTVSVKPGTATTIQFLASNAVDSDYARTTTYFMTDDINVWMRSMLGNTSPMNTASVITARVNVNASCNATYGGNNMNFYRKSSSCFNTAYGTVIYHEWGHGIDDRHGGISQTHGLSEGWGDICAILRSKQHLVGAGFRLNGSPVRTALNTKTYPPSGGVHSQGEVWMGWVWDFRTNMVAKFGTTLGHTLTEKSVMPSIVADATSQPPAVREVFIINDDDGNLNNGVPNYTELEKACLKRKMPYPKRLAGDLQHTPITVEVEKLAPVCINATMKLLFGSLTKFDLVYKVGNGAAQTRPMVSRGGDKYMALLPGVIGGTVSYHVVANHSTGEIFRSPATGEHSYNIGRDIAFSDDFEGTDKGWTHAKVTKEDDWQLGTPTGKSGSEGSITWQDPKAAKSGTKCWANDLNGQYSASVENYLRSPVINLTGKTGVVLRFGRWLSVEGFFDSASIQVNGKNVWKNELFMIRETAWSTQEIDISALADNKSSVQLEFRLKSDGDTSLGGWAIDDVQLLGSSTASLPLELRVTPEQVGIGKSTTATLKGPANKPIVIAWSLTPGTTVIPGIGTLDMGNPITVIAITTLDNTGNWSLNSTVPNKTGLVGTLAFSQAIVDNGGKIDVSNSMKILISQ